MDDWSADWSSDWGNRTAIAIGAVIGLIVLAMNIWLNEPMPVNSGFAKCDTDTDCMEKFGGNGDPE